MLSHLLKWWWSSFCLFYIKLKRNSVIIGIKSFFLFLFSFSFHWCLICPLPSFPEYDRHLAAAVSAGKNMATAYLDPNLNHALLGGAKSRLSAGGSDRTMAGSVDRVLKVFHHFETNTESSCWSSNIRYGDATDVRVRGDTMRWMCCD